MRKFMFLMAVLSLLLIALGVSAEEAAAYIPGVPTNTLMKDTAAAGKLICFDIAPVVDADLSLFVEEEELDTYNALIAAIQNVDVAVGAGATPAGARFEVKARYEAEEGNEVTIEGGILLDQKGISIDSDVIPGKKITVDWATAMDLVGMEEDQKSIVLSILSGEFDFDALFAQIQEIAEQLIEALMPYGEDAVAWASGLSIEFNENVEADGIFPAVASEVVVHVSDAEFAALLTTWLDRLAGDETLLPYLKNISDSEDPVAELRGLAEALNSSEGALTVYVGVGEEILPAYASIVRTEEGKQAGALLGILQPKDDAYNLVLQVLNGESEAICSFDGSMAIDPEDFNAFDLLMEMAFNAEDDIFNMSYALSRKADTTDEGLPAYTMELQEVISVNDGGAQQNVIAQAQGYSALNAAGGEDEQVAGTVDITADGAQIHMDIYGEMTIVPDADAGFVQNCIVLYGLPEYGISQIGGQIIAWGEDFDADAYAALEAVPFETLDEEGFSALQEEVMGNLMSKAFGLLSVVPSEVLNLVLGSGE